MLQALLMEIGMQQSYLNGETVETIYFGGGTPSVLEPAEISLLIGAIANIYTVSPDAEITMEANPDDLDAKKLTGLRATAVNRFSIGIQSFFDDDLQWMNRVHRAAEAEDCVKRAQDAGFENISVDLIYGYPLLTDSKWNHNLHKAFELNVPHISAYSMTVEPQTALASFIHKKKQPPMSDRQSAEQFLVMINAMQANGFDQYEISNFCKPGNNSRHNSNYWHGTNYLGIGPSAHSFNGKTRQWNIANNAKYLQSILTDKIVPAEVETLTEANRLNEYVMTSLRTVWGLNLDKLDEIANHSATMLIKAADPYFINGSLNQSGKVITLTNTGKLFADQITADLFFS